MRRVDLLLNNKTERKVVEQHFGHIIVFHNKTCRIDSLAVNLDTRSVVLVTPPQVIMKLSWDKEKSASAEITFGNRKRPACASSRKLGRWGIPLMPFSLM